ncbi:WD40-repeat-containing domain protein [Pisolithus microcarpus]|nr:WD40-repeat-containing domain protein [Pisolithus microcarpus]
MAAAEVLNHTPLVVPQPKDVSISQIPRQSLPHQSGKRSKKYKEKRPTVSHHPQGSGSDEQRSGGSRKAASAPSRKWSWTSLTDTSVSSHPPIFTKDGSHFFSIAGSTIKIHSASSGKVVSMLPRSQDEGHTDTITSVTLGAHNSFQLFTASLDGTIKVWDFLEGILLRTIDLDQPIHHICTHEKIKDYIFVAAAKIKKSKISHVQDESCVVLRVSLNPRESGGLTRTHKPPDILAIGKIKRTVGLALSASGERLIAISGRRSYVAQTAALKAGFMKFTSPESLTCLAVHPFEEYFATGDVKGVVRLWYCLNSNLVKVVGVEKKSQTSAFHWHAHAVSSVAFSTNGAYLLSGGEEAVLVIWQIHTGKREFVPRVGSPIKSVVVSPPKASEEEYLLELADATHAFVSSKTLKLSRVFARIKLAPSVPNAFPSSSSIPLAFHNLSETLVLPSSHASSLQTFSPSAFALVAELEVAPSNRVSRKDEKMLEPSRVERAVISSTGEWMATIDCREGDEYFRGEMYLKFWYWDKKNAFWILNTRIDRPHGLCKITSMSFSPGPSNIQLVTIGNDGNVKGWRIRTTKDKKGQEEISWVTRSSFGYKSDTPRHASWSPDGSLLAVVFGPSVVLYDPYTNVPRHVFVCHESQRLHEVHFIGMGGRFLATVGGTDLVVWNVMSRSVLWHVKNDRPYETLLPHPHRDAFMTIHSSHSTPAHAVVTIFHVRSPIRQMEHTLPFALRNVIWYPQSYSPANSESFSLVGLTHSYSVVLMGDDVNPQEKRSVPFKTLRKGQSVPRKSLFEEMFGVPVIPSESQQHSRDQITANPGPALPWRSSETASFFDAPSHLIPPIHTFFESLVDGFLTLRVADEGRQEELDVQEETSSKLSDHSGPVFANSADIATDSVLDTLVPVFREIAESSDYSNDSKKASVPPNTVPVLAKSTPRHAPRLDRPPQSDSPTPNQSVVPLGPVKVGKKRSRPSLG